MPLDMTSQETDMKIQKNMCLNSLVGNLMIALHQGKDPRFKEIMGVMQQAIREEAQLIAGSTPDEVYAFTAVPRKVADYVNVKYPHLLSLANLPDEYFGHG